MTEVAEHADTQTRNDLSLYIFLPGGTSKLVLSHSIPSVEFGQALYNAVTNRINTPINEGGYGGNDRFGVYRTDNGELTGSNLFMQILVDNMLAPFGARTALPVDLADDGVLRAVKDKFYVDSRALVLRGSGECYEINIPIFEGLAEHVGDLSTPVLVLGLTVLPWSEDEKGYGLKIVPADDFQSIQDDRLNPKWKEYKFDCTDSIGLPVGLDKKKGNRTWYTSDQQLSRLCLDRGLDVNSDDGDLADSYGDGRVVIASSETGAPNLDRILDAKSKNELLQGLKQVNAVYQKLRGEK